jgi:hypothetical protein
MDLDNGVLVPTFFTIKQVMEVRRDFSKEIYIGLVEMEKTFDRQVCT